MEKEKMQVTSIFSVPLIFHVYLLRHNFNYVYQRFYFFFPKSPVDSKPPTNYQRKGLKTVLDDFLVKYVASWSVSYFPPDFAWFGE